MTTNNSTNNWFPDLRWQASGSTSGGIVTFYPTDDETGTGNALFSAIRHISTNARRDTGLPTQIPFSAVKSISGDLKTILVNVGVGTILGLLGATILGAPDGLVVTIEIIGTPA